MANSSTIADTVGFCRVNLKIENFIYQAEELLIIKDLCSDGSVGHGTLRAHSSEEIGFEGNRPPQQSVL